MAEGLTKIRKIVLNNLERFVIGIFLIILMIIVFLSSVGFGPQFTETAGPPPAPNLSLPNENSQKVIENINEPKPIIDSSFNILVAKNIFDSKETKSQEEIERELSEKITALKELWKNESYDEIIKSSSSILKQYPTHSIANKFKSDSEKILNTMTEVDKLLQEYKIDDANKKYNDIIKEMPDRNILKVLKTYIDIKNLEVQRNFQEMTNQVEEALKKWPDDKKLLEYRERAQLGMQGKLPTPTPAPAPTPTPPGVPSGMPPGALPVATPGARPGAP